MIFTNYFSIVVNTHDHYTAGALEGGGMSAKYALILIIESLL